MHAARACTCPLVVFICTHVQRIPDTIQGAVLGFGLRAPNNDRAVDVLFGPAGFSSALARGFSEVSIIFARIIFLKRQSVSTIVVSLMDHSFNTIGFHPAHTTHHPKTQAAFIQFDPLYKDAKKPIVSLSYPVNISGYRCQENILSQEAGSLTQVGI